MSASTTILNRKRENGNRYFAKQNAAKEDITTWPAVPMTETNTVLKIYRVKGTIVPDIRRTISLKFRKVGL